MNITESHSESSCNGQEDGDASSGNERPLKKARYAWQVKGKYHLKNETNDSNKNAIISPSASSSSSSCSNIRINDVDEYILKQDYSQLESVIDPSTSLLTPNTSVVSEPLQYPRYISSNERASANRSIQSDRNRYLLPFNNAFGPLDNILYTKKKCIEEDHWIEQWQQEQFVKCFIDNLLNESIERLPEDDGDNRYMAVDVAEFVNHFPGDNSVENEGIMMAIAAHGIQYSLNHRSISETSMASNEESSSSSQSANIAAALGDWSPTPYLEYYCQQPQETKTFEYLSEPSNSPNSDNQIANIDTNDDFDIMNAAILHAIKTKGLSVSGTEYG